MLKRRELFRAAGLTALGAGLSPIYRLRAEAAEAGTTRFVSVYFTGGWDTLIGLDSRTADRSGIQMGRSLLRTADRRIHNVNIGGGEAIWGSAMNPIVTAGHTDLCTLFRGVNMNTVAHATGRAYVNTFRQPSGAVPRGASLPTVMAHGPLDAGMLLPNVSVGMPSLNPYYGPELNGVRLNRASQVVSMVKPIARQLPDDVELALRIAQDESRGCVSVGYRDLAPEHTLRDIRQRVRQLLDDRAVRAALEFDADTPEMAQLRSDFGFSVADITRSPEHPGVPAAVAAQLLRLGLTRSVSIRLNTQLDTHGAEWARTQVDNQRQGWSAVSALLTDLRRDDPDLSNTIVVCTSEFAREPVINGRRGRNHWFASAVAVFGGALRRGVCGETNLNTFNLQRINFNTGRPARSGGVLKPEHIGATIAASAGVPENVIYEAYRTAPLDAWVGGA